MHRIGTIHLRPSASHLQTFKSDKTDSLGLRSAATCPWASSSGPQRRTHKCGWITVTSSQGPSHLLKFTTPLGMPVGVLKAGSSFSPSLMAFTRNTCREKSKGTESELSGVVILTQSRLGDRSGKRRSAATEPGLQTAGLCGSYTRHFSLSINFCVHEMPGLFLRW